MCGIAGIYNFDHKNGVDENVLWRMGDEIAHRGPDNKGVYSRRNMGLAYRRLSIIDTQERPQPILRNEDKTLRISFNGEIYNFKELRAELEEKGHVFYTGTDTEMVLHLYEEEGTACVKRLNGIFAFAIMDLRDESMFIARDQLGIKPLYYTETDKGVFFSSEIKSLIGLTGVNKKVDPEAVSHYFDYRFVPDPLTMFDHIYKLPPGHWMRLANNRVEIKHYWSMRSTMQSPLDQDAHTEAEITQSIRATVEDAVKRQMIADVPLGAFLSGGIDSSIVVGLMAQMKDEPIKTFSVGFSEKSFNETNFARMVADKYQTDHHEIILEPSHVRELPEIIWHLDEPLADPAAVPTYFLSRMASEQVKVVLTGEGGDELFAGYKEDFAYGLSSWLKIMPSSVRRALSEIIGDMHGLKGQTRLYRSLLPDKKRAEHILFDLFRFEEPPILPYLFNPDYLDRHDQRQKHYTFDYFWDKAANLDWLSKMLYFESKIWLPGDPLMKVDKVTMANALEARVPLLDMEVVKLATKIPSNLKNKNNVEKYLLRKAFADLMPTQIQNRQKTAFELPVASWLQGELKDMVYDYIFSSKLKDAGIFVMDEVEAVVEKHMRGERDYKYEIWALLTFAIWHDQYF